MERMELRYEELRVSSVCARSSTVDKCREPSDEPRLSIAAIRAILRWGDNSQESNERERTSTGSDPDVNGALAWRVLITRYAPKTAPRVQSLMSAILNAKTFPSELTANGIALDEWQENIRK